MCHRAAPEPRFCRKSHKDYPILPYTCPKDCTQMPQNRRFCLVFGFDRNCYLQIKSGVYALNPTRFRQSQP
jgi:hypothetical protein